MQHTGRRTHHSWPALYTALLLTAGIIAGYRYGCPLVSAEIATPILILSSLALTGIAVCVPQATPSALSLAGVCVVLSTGCVLGAALHNPPGQPSEQLTRSPVTILGTVLDPPSRSGNALRFRCALHAILRDSVIQESEAIAMVALRVGDMVGQSSLPHSGLTGPGRGTTVPDHGTTATDPLTTARDSGATTPEPGLTAPDYGMTNPDYGMTVALHGMLETPRGVRNPGEFDAQEFYRANGITLLLTVKGSRHVRILHRDGGWWGMRQVVVPARRALLAHIENHIGGEEGEFLKGLMIGERGGLTPELRNAFLTSGVAHILAVSGSNVAVVAAAVLASLLLLRIPRGAHPYVVAAAVLFYMLLTGSQPSVVRATIMSLVALAVSGRGARGNPLNAIGMAALIMYGIDVRQLFDVGFQLSFAAVLSIVVLYPKVDILICAWKGKRWFHQLAKGGLRLGAVSLVASAGTFPLTASSFGQVSLIGLLANIVVVPVSGWSVVLGLLSAAVAAVSTAAAESLCALNTLALSLTLHAVRMCASVPCASIPAHWFTPIWTFPFLGLLGMACHARDASLCRSWCLFTLCAANVAVYVPPRSSILQGMLAVTVLDVGQGDAILIEHPDGGTVLVDTGPPPVDTRSGLVPYLVRRGIPAIEIVLITHSHADHAGGLASLRSVMPVQRLITHTAAQPGTLIPWREDCRLQVLFADPHNAARSAADNPGANRYSVVIRLVYGNTAFIFAADAEHQEEERMIAAYAHGLRSEVLKIGHHGSPSATTYAWLDAVRPAYAIVSVGRGNRFGHPSDSVLQRLRDRDITVTRTDEEGAVMMVSDGHAVRRVVWR